MTTRTTRTFDAILEDLLEATSRSARCGARAEVEPQSAARARFWTLCNEHAMQAEDLESELRVALARIAALGEG